MSKRKIAIIQARLGSSRLPNKMMLNLHGYPIIEWVVKRVSKSKLIDEVIVATSTSQENDILEYYLLELGVQVFRGSEDNVLDRFYKTALQFNADEVIRICADNPLVSPVEIDNLISFYSKNTCDYAYNHIPLENNYPDGFGAEIVSFNILEQLYSEVSSTKHKEHCFSYILDNPHKFTIKTFDPPEKEIALPDLRFDIDTFEDYYYLWQKKMDIDISAKEIIDLFKDLK